MRKTPIEMTRKNAIKLMSGDNLELLKGMPDNCVDAIVSDPPYALNFMGKKWDSDVPSVEFWKEIYRVLKPGGHVLSFGGTRTYHRMVVNIEDAGFEIRDQIMWLYGSGFPKSHNIGKSVDKIRGSEREVVGKLQNYQDKRGLNGQANVGENAKPRIDMDITKGTSEWEGWGTALKPANEPICVARKPISEKTVADNVLKWGTGGINIDGCRIATNDAFGGGAKATAIFDGVGGYSGEGWEPGSELGRFPANVILDEVAGQMLDQQSGITKSTPMKESIRKESILGKETNSKKDIYAAGAPKSGHSHSDKGGASRFFYCAKVSKKERNAGLDSFETKKVCQGGYDTGWSSDKKGDLGINKVKEYKNDHPTVKPIALMAYLCRLVTPKQGLVLDPFMGSGSTGCAAIQEGFRFAGMELDPDYFEIAKARIEHYYKKTYENGNDE